MTKQRRTEKFNLDLAKCILTDYSDQLEQYDTNKLTQYISKNKWNLIPEYIQGGEDLDGRNSCRVGLASFSRKLRNTLSYQHYQDIDMINAGYSWLKMEMKKNNITCIWVEDYCDNREFILSKYMNDNNCDRDKAKKSFTGRLFRSDDKELKQLVDIYKNKDLEHKLYHKLLVEKGEKNVVGKFMNYLYHKWEWNTIDKIMELFEKKKVKCFADLHDGFYIEKNVSNSTIDNLLEIVKEKFNVRMKVKEMDEFLNIPKEYIENYYKSKNESDSNEYESFREEFETTKRVYKVVDQEKFLFETDDGYFLRSQQSIINMYNDWTVTGTQLFKLWGGGEKRFIYNYVSDPAKRMVDRIDFYPNPDKCPPEVYNLFTGFFITKIEDIFTEKDHKDFELILEHLKILVDDGEPYVDTCYEYILDWCSQIFQEPDIKSLSMIIIKGGEGTGKSLLVQQLGYMMGEKYYLSTANAVNDLFGNFNSIAKNRLLINIDEVEHTQTDKVYEQLKNLITRNKASINEKFEKPMVINDYIRYFMTTNNEGVVKISDTNRRFVAFESIHAARKDIDNVKDAFFNDKALKLFYNFLMKRDISKRVWKDFPKTKYYKRCLDASISNTYKFLDNLFSSPIVFDSYYNDKTKTLTNKIKKTDLREQYEMWCMINKICTFKKTIFEAEIESTYLFMQRRTSTERLWIFDKDKVIDKLKKMGLYDQTIFLDE